MRREASPILQKDYGENQNATGGSTAINNAYVQVIQYIRNIPSNIFKIYKFRQNNTSTRVLFVCTMIACVVEYPR